MKTLNIDTNQKDLREIRVSANTRGIPVRVRQRGHWLQVINIQRRLQGSSPEFDKPHYSFFELALENGTICTVGKSQGAGHWVEAIPRCHAVLSSFSSGFTELCSITSEAMPPKMEVVLAGSS
jgi:hypothetical protein